MTVPDIFAGYSAETLQAFKAYHRKRPEIMQLFTKYANEMRSTGRNHYGAKSIMERIRWDQDIQYKDAEFKIGNNFTALYVRLLIYRDPTFEGFFRLRRVRGIGNPHFEQADIRD